jgi:hypothetical protein
LQNQYVGGAAMKRKYIEEKEGAKERFDRAMSTIFQAPKVATKAGQAVKKKASPSRKSAPDKKGS